MNRRAFLMVSAFAFLVSPGWAQDAAEEDLGVADNLADTNGASEVDWVLAPEHLVLLNAVHQRLERVRQVVGYGHFNLLGFDAMLKAAARHSRIGMFTQDELAFIEEIFHTDATSYGFFGQKVLTQLTDTIPVRDVVKVPGTGHYLYKGHALAMYGQITADMGPHRVVLTSGVRSPVKQLQLFLAKAIETGGNLSVASRSLAPPGYSYHGIGDFDVGKVGFGVGNFTEAFALTEEFRRLQQLGYVAIRYPHGNPDGVRYEPWHIKVV